jgi:cephalosporin-C deacetylase-like acetyl esterase
LLLTLLGPAWAAGSGPAVADDKLADRLGRLEAVVATSEEQKELAATLAADIRRRRQELDERWSAAWGRVATREDWEKFRNPALAALRASLGQFPTLPRSLNVRTTGKVVGDGFQIDNVVFESRPGWWVTANLYRPAKPGGSMPGLLICHSHHNPKEHGELQDMGMTWARAGCLVLVMDQLGHGERRQHPFPDAGSFSRPFRVSRQDYHFRYDLGVQLHLTGDSLIGWMVQDLMRGVDLLLGEKGIDPRRILLLGAVAGGGDPAAVTAALDERIAAVAPFNFGGPSPQPLYPFPPEKEPRWNYVGGGSWESTRNLRRAASDGFPPWVVVGAIAPRRLIYAHEFAWYREGDPVWKRLQKVYGFYDAPDRLSSTHGKGDVTRRPPEGTHCNHIGAVHRKEIHEAFRRWFAIDVSPDDEYSKRLPADRLRCWTAEAQRDVRPRNFLALVRELADERMAQARKRSGGKSAGEQRRLLQAEWKRLLGEVEPCEKVQARRRSAEKVGGVAIERFLLTTEPGIVVPLLLLRPEGAGKKPVPAVVAVSQAGKAALLHERSADVAALLEGGVAVCLADVRGTGETRSGRDRGRNSSATALSSGLLMMGETQVGCQLRDLRAVLAWLRTYEGVDAGRIAVWGDSLAPVNGPATDYNIPRDDDAALPAQSEPLGGLLALLAGLYDDRLQAIHVRGGLLGFRSVLDSHLVLIPHDAVVPGALLTGDLGDIVTVLAPRPVRLEGLVDGGNRRMQGPRVREAYRRAAEAYRERGAAAALSLPDDTSPPSRWLLSVLQGK